jgi:hypothetical protein
MDRLPGRVDARTAAESAWSRALDAAVHGHGDHSVVSGWMPSGRGLDSEALEAAGGPRGLRRILDVSEDSQQLGWMRREFLDRFLAQQVNRAAGLLPDGRRPQALEPGQKELAEAAARIGGSIDAHAAAVDHPPNDLARAIVRMAKA